MLYWIDMFFAIIGAGAILFALAFVSSVIGIIAKRSARR